MKKSIKYLAMVIAVSAFYVSNAHAGEAAPAKRTWAQYAQQKVAANNLLASKDARQAANIKLQLGSAQIEEAKATQEAEKQRAKTIKQQADIAAAREDQRQLDAINARIANKTAVAETLKTNRENVRSGKAIAPVPQLLREGFVPKTKDEKREIRANFRAAAAAAKAGAVVVR